MALTSIYDDPGRAAPPWEAPGEQYPGDAQEISNTAATAAALEVLNSGGEAFGYDAQCYAEALRNQQIRTTEDEISLAIAVLQPNSIKAARFRAKWVRQLGAMANDSGAS